MTNIVIWKPSWYDLDSTIITDDIGIFYLKKDKLEFASGLMSNDEYEVKARIISIEHPEIPNIKAIHCCGLSYFIYYDKNKKISVCCEENPGQIYSGDIKNIENWEFKVELEIIEEHGITFKERLNTLNSAEKKKWFQDTLIRQNLLLAEIVKSCEN